MRKKSQQSKMSPAIAASMLYYGLEEFEKFFILWDSIANNSDIITDGPFAEYVERIRIIIEKATANGKESFNKEYLLQALRDMNMIEPDARRKERFEVWLNEVVEKDDESLFKLPTELFYTYEWELFKDYVETIDKKPLAHQDKLSAVDPQKFMVSFSKEDGFFSLGEEEDEEENAKGKYFRTYIDVLDDIVKPVSSNFLVIAARPSVGKSTLMLSMALENASHGVKSIFISLEMSKDQIQEKVFNWYKQRVVHRSEWPEIRKEEAFQRLSKYFLPACDLSSNPDVFMKRCAQRIAKDPEIGIVFLDYLQIARYPNLDEWSSLRKLTRDCKVFAKDNNVLFVSCTQVSRESTKYGLDLESLFGSSTIENDTDIVIGLESTSRDAIQKGGKFISASVLKNRMGEKGSEIKMLVDYPIMSFTGR